MPAVITITAEGCTAATPVTVGVPDTAWLDFYPEACAMAVGEQRQFIIRERLDDAPRSPVL